MSVTRLGALRACSLSLLACLTAVCEVSAQGPFVNFELPSVKPIAVANVGGAWYVLVCNGADNSVEIYSAASNTFLMRVPTGLHPVTVRWNPTLSAFFTCNFLGDSITKVTLQTSGGPLPIAATTNYTRDIGDEPSDIVFRTSSEALVTLSSSSSLKRVDLTTWQTTVVLLGDTAAAASHTKRLKEPRRMNVASDGRVTVLGTRGGVDGSATYDFDLVTLTFDGSGNVTTAVPKGGLGTSTFGMERSSDSRLWVTGNKALITLVGEPALSTARTGFVQSQLAVIDPVTSAVSIRNLNVTHNNTIAALGDAISMPTDVAAYEVNGVVQRLFVTSFLSDRIAWLDVTSNLDPTTWQLTTIDLRNFAVQPYRNVGPRAFALKPADATGGAKLYVANTLRPSFVVIDPAQPTTAPVWIPLHQDPTPDTVLKGRKGLYDSRISGKGFVACASCHLDGGTDGLPWRLEVVAPSPLPAVWPPAIPAGLLGDGIDASTLPDPGVFPLDKGRMITQNLHGLVNHLVPGAGQELYSNKPYHWRGDRADFVAFNGAFVRLLGATVNHGTPGDPKGLSDIEMDEYRKFIDTCVYPPNPEQNNEQKFDRRVVDVAGNNALQGRTLFHTKGLPGDRFDGRSCVHCHSGASGSNNRLTEIDDLDPTNPIDQPVETAAIRSLRSREARFETGFDVPAAILTAEFGLTRAGRAQSRSINEFHLTSFGNLLTQPEREAIVAFVRQFDAGIAPIVGHTYTVDMGNVTTQEATDAFRRAEDQVKDANAGLAVHVCSPAGVTGYWFDMTVNPPVYRLEGGTATHTGLTLKALVNPTTVLILQSTPAGSERRIANPNGVATPLLNPTVPPANVFLRPMHAPTQWLNVTSLTANALVVPGDLTKARSLQTFELYQKGLILHGLLTAHRHEAVQRLCVIGENLRAGAVLELGVPISQTPPTVKYVITLPIFPTSRTTTLGQTIWETTAELDPLFAYQLLLGGPEAPGVTKAFDDPMPLQHAPSIFDSTWNNFRVVVRNEDNSASSPVWQALSID